MSEQGTPEGAPAVAGPEGTPGTAEATAAPEIDWQDRYQHLQPEYTRVTQENAELRRSQELYELLVSSDDEDTRRRVAQELGYVLEGEQNAQPPGADEDPFTRYNERLDRLEQTQRARDEQEADDAYAADVRQAVDRQLAELAIDEDDQDWVLAYAINALPVTNDGLPDIGQAFEVFQQRELARQRKWAQTKRAPAISPHGQPATEVPNLDNRQERIDFQVRRLQEMQEQT